MSVLFAAAAVLTAVLAMAWLFVPGTMLKWWQADPNPSSIYMARRGGVLFLGFAVLLWGSRDAATTPAGLAIAAGAAVVSTAMMIASVVGIRQRVVGLAVWGAAAVEAGLAAAFWYFLLTAR